ncbi:MAG: carbohydrate ABC transporter permease [Clostridia bacterium]
MKKQQNKILASRGERIFYKINGVVMGLLILITIYPMLYVIFCSFSDPDQFAFKMGTMMLAPAGFSLKGYQTILSMPSIWLGYRTTIFYVVVGTLISMAFTVIGAYILSRKEFMLKKTIMALVVFTMYFSGGMIPTYLAVKEIGLTNSIWGFLLPGAVSVYNMIVLRTSFNAIPQALMDSAYIDGAGDGRILLHVVLPLSTAALATITLFYAVGYWGAWYNALVYLQARRDLYPLQMYLREILITDQTTDAFMNALNGNGANQYLLKEVIKYCTIVIATVPILLVYPFIQKYFVKGVMLGAIKE